MAKHLRPIERIIGWRLIEGGTLSRGALVHAAYGGRADGGPVTADKCAYLYIHRFRLWAAEIGVPIKTLTCYGWSIAHDDIERLRDALALEIAEFA